MDNPRGPLGVEEIPFIYRHNVDMAMLAVAKVIKAKGNPKVCGNQKDNVYSLRKDAATENKQTFIQLSFWEDGDEGKFVSILTYCLGALIGLPKNVFLPYPHSMNKKSDEDFLVEVGNVIKDKYQLLP